MKSFFNLLSPKYCRYARLISRSAPLLLISVALFSCGPLDSKGTAPPPAHTNTVPPSNCSGPHSDSLPGTAIKTWQELQNMRDNLKGIYYLANDITLPTPGNDKFPQEGFEPIGHDTDPNDRAFRGTPFTGSFNGNGYTIRNLSIQRPDEYFVGLFGRVKDGRIINVCLENVNILGSRSVGGIVGSNHGGTVSGAVIGGPENSVVKNLGEYTGGLAGWSSHGGTVTGFVNMKVVGSDNVYPGRNQNPNSNDIGKSTGGRIGGLVGALGGDKSGGSTVRGYALGEVTYTHTEGGHAYWVGGLVGINWGTVIGYSANTVSGSRMVGGLVGIMGEFRGTSAKVIGYSRGTVRITDPDPELLNLKVPVSTDVGGLLGTNESGQVRGYSTAKIVVVDSLQDQDGNEIEDYVGNIIGKIRLRNITPLGENSMQGYFKGTINGQQYDNTVIGIIEGSETGVNSGGIFTPSGSDVPRMFYKARSGDTGEGALQITASTSQNDFPGFDFGSDVGQWTFHKGRWPSINLGSAMVGSRDIFADLSQPTAP